MTYSFIHSKFHPLKKLAQNFNLPRFTSCKVGLLFVIVALYPKIRIYLFIKCECLHCASEVLLDRLGTFAFSVFLTWMCYFSLIWWYVKFSMVSLWSPVSFVLMSQYTFPSKTLVTLISSHEKPYFKLFQIFTICYVHYIPFFLPTL